MRFSRTIQTAFKDLSIQDMGPRRFVTLVRQRRIEIPLLTYLSVIFTCLNHYQEDNSECL